MDFYAFYTGQEFEAYKYLGAHLEGDKCVFRTFAPQAAGIELILQDRAIPMNRIFDGNFYEVTAEAHEGDTYEYRIYGKDGSVRSHMDPYGYGVELRPNHKSIVVDTNKKMFSDQKWMKNRTNRKNEALNIYEIHAGSWKKKSQEQEGWYNYKELAELLIPYLEENHYNYVEFMPLCEYPSDESWGYQNTGYFAPTTRYGSAVDLKTAVDLFHQHKIGVLLDFVPVHFAMDDYSLRKYDSTYLYCKI